MLRDLGRPCRLGVGSKGDRRPLRYARFAPFYCPSMQTANVENMLRCAATSASLAGAIESEANLLRFDAVCVSSVCRGEPEKDFSYDSMPFAPPPPPSQAKSEPEEDFDTVRTQNQARGGFSGDIWAPSTSLPSESKPEVPQRWETEAPMPIFGVSPTSFHHRYHSFPLTLCTAKKMPACTAQHRCVQLNTAV